MKIPSVKSVWTFTRGRIDFDFLLIFYVHFHNIWKMSGKSMG